MAWMEGPQSLGRCREGRRSPVPPGAGRGDGFYPITQVISGKSSTVMPGV